MKTISFDTSAKDAALLTRIAKRAHGVAIQHGIEYSIMDALMDLTACHCNGSPLDLEEMIAIPIDDYSFRHDVFGIRRHINRRTGKLEGCFFPRFAIRETARETICRLAE